MCDEERFISPPFGELRQIRGALPSNYLTCLPPDRIHEKPEETVANACKLSNFPVGRIARFRSKTAIPERPDDGAPQGPEGRVTGRFLPRADLTIMSPECPLAERPFCAGFADKVFAASIGPA
jgi:hypothetical protein